MSFNAARIEWYAASAPTPCLINKNKEKKYINRKTRTDDTKQKPL